MSQERRLEVWRSVDFCGFLQVQPQLLEEQSGQLHCPQVSVGSCQSFPASAVAPCSAVAHSRQSAIQMQISQLTGLIKENSINMHSALEPLPLQVPLERLKEKKKKNPTSTTEPAATDHILACSLLQPTWSLLKLFLVIISCF